MSARLALCSQRCAERPLQLTAFPTPGGFVPAWQAESSPLPGCPRVPRAGRLGSARSSAWPQLCRWLAALRRAPRVAAAASTPLATVWPPRALASTANQPYTPMDFCSGARSRAGPRLGHPWYPARGSPPSRRSLGVRLNSFGATSRRDGRVMDTGSSVRGTPTRRPAVAAQPTPTQDSCRCPAAASATQLGWEFLRLPLAMLELAPRHRPSSSSWVYRHAPALPVHGTGDVVNLRAARPG